MNEDSILEYFRKNSLPHIWCPGCGNGTVTGALVRAIKKTGLDKNKICVVSGIGCSSRAVGYLDFDTVHATHGRALAFATGIKLARPEMKVVVMTGDGDCAAIGGNHFIHAARRNIEITTIVMNNSIYGMTSGQASPMTPKGMICTTAPYGSIDRNFDLCELAKSAGATYIGRATAYHVPLLIELIAEALRNKGFSVIEALVQCPTYMGRKNDIGGAVEMLERFRDSAVDVKAAAHLSPDKVEGKTLIGELYRSSAPEYSAEYRAMASKLRRSYGDFRGGLYGCASNSD
jgi:2-oxoglutarate ferredoxin oxidoreductase subunit beta